MIAHFIDTGFGIILSIMPFLHLLILILLVIKAIHFYSHFHVWYYEVWLYFPKNVIKSVEREDKQLPAMKFQNTMTTFILLLFTADLILVIIQRFSLDFN